MKPEKTEKKPQPKPAKKPQVAEIPEPGPPTQVSGPVKTATAPEDQTKKPGFYVAIVHTETGRVEKDMGPMSESKAERCERGALINLNTAAYHVDTYEVGPDGKRVAT